MKEKVGVFPKDIGDADKNWHTGRTNHNWWKINIKDTEPNTITNEHDNYDLCVGFHTQPTYLIYKCTWEALR